MNEVSIEDKVKNKIKEFVEEKNKREEMFYHDVIKYFINLNDKKQAQKLLKAQVRKLRKEYLANIKYSRPLTDAEQNLINDKLKTTFIGISNNDESILDYKIRKDKEFLNHYKKIISEYPEYKDKFFNILKSYRHDISIKAYKRSEVVQSLYCALYHLITPYNSTKTHYHESSIGFILKDMPHINEIMSIKDFNSSNLKYFLMGNPEYFQNIVAYISKEQMSAFISEDIMARHAVFYSENVGKIEFFRMQQKIEKRLPLFLSLCKEYSELILNK